MWLKLFVKSSKMPADSSNLQFLLLMQLIEHVFTIDIVLFTIFSI
jgi:hypothetical protein